jgi:hypothetical protein
VVTLSSGENNFGTPLSAAHLRLHAFDDEPATGGAESPPAMPDICQFRRSHGITEQGECKRNTRFSSVSRCKDGNYSLNRRRQVSAFVGHFFLEPSTLSP